MKEGNLIQEIEILKNEIENLKKARENTLFSNRFGKFIKKSFTKLHLVIGVVITVGVSFLIVYASPISKPYTFTDGTVISASEVNANFDTLYETAWSKVDTGGIYYDGGNVGIGTTGPRTPLEISGSGGDYLLRLQSNEPSYIDQYMQFKAGGTIKQYFADNSSNYFSIETTGGNASGGFIRMRVDGTEIMLLSAKYCFIVPPALNCMY